VHACVPEIELSKGETTKTAGYATAVALDQRRNVGCWPHHGIRGSHVDKQRMCGECMSDDCENEQTPLGVYAMQPLNVLHDVYVCL
jgi:hypothetical protein